MRRIYTILHLYLIVAIRLHLLWLISKTTKCPTTSEFLQLFRTSAKFLQSAFFAILYQAFRDAPHSLCLAVASLIAFRLTIRMTNLLILRSLSQTEKRHFIWRIAVNHEKQAPSVRQQQLLEGQAPETMSVMFSFGLEPDLRFAEAESGGVCFSVPPCPIGAKSLQIKSIGPADLDLEFSIPIFVIQGEEDFTTPTALARQYLESIKAPRKEFVLIKGGGHFAVFMRSDQFLQELVAGVRPPALAT